MYTSPTAAEGAAGSGVRGRRNRREDCFFSHLKKYLRLIFEIGFPMATFTLIN